MRDRQPCLAEVRAVWAVRVCPAKESKPKFSPGSSHTSSSPRTQPLGPDAGTQIPASPLALWPWQVAYLLHTSVSSSKNGDESAYPAGLVEGSGGTADKEKPLALHGAQKNRRWQGSCPQGWPEGTEEHPGEAGLTEGPRCSPPLLLGLSEVAQDGWGMLCSVHREPTRPQLWQPGFSLL